MSEFSFKIIKKAKQGKARRGVLSTPHGDIETPVFMPVGTQATVKGLTPAQLLDEEVSILLSNTYHLSLRPGVELIRDFGGLHDFMNWQKPILTDSGGFQVFSLAKQRKISDSGVRFQSHLDGSTHHFTPESVIDLQFAFNSDILMPLDICSPYPCSEAQIKADMKRTHAWAAQAKSHWEREHQGRWLFGIVQGGMYRAQREASAKALQAIDFPGYALGGISVGEPPDLLADMLSFGADLLPEHKPKYAMGIGLPENLAWAIDHGIDMFDCVLPTRLARHGQVFFRRDGQPERRNITRAEYATDKRPIDETCPCYTCKHFSRAYLRHLFMAKELLAHTLLSIHNIRFLMDFVKSIRDKI
eukprot:COSAG01_NODE_1222_length_11150_cov_2.405755_4_plen_359_part_00